MHYASGCARAVAFGGLLSLDRIRNYQTNPPGRLRPAAGPPPASSFRRFHVWCRHRESVLPCSITVHQLQVWSSYIKPFRTLCIDYTYADTEIYFLIAAVQLMTAVSDIRILLGEARRAQNHDGINGWESQEPLCTFPR